MEPGRDLGRRTAGTKLDRAERHDVRRRPEAPGIRLSGREAGELFQPDGGLSFVGRALPDPEHRCNGVEEPSHSTRERRRELEALSHLPPARPRDVEAGALEVDGRNAPRLGDRCRSARQRNGLQMREALELTKVAPEELAAPERPIRPVSRSVEDER